MCSIIGVMEHDECVFDHTRKDTMADTPRPKTLFRSRFQKKLIRDLRRRRGVFNHRTLGVAESEYNDPCNYLKKQGGIHAPIPQIDHICFHPGVEGLPNVFQRPVKRPPKPKMPKNCRCVIPVPKCKCCIRDFKCECESEMGRDFIRENICLAINSNAKYPVIRVVDANKGHWEYMQPRFVYRKEFGKVPRYILDNMNAVIDEQRQCNEEKVTKPKCRYIDQLERGKLLLGLKQNWEQMNLDYQKLSVTVDTEKKVVNRTKREREMTEIEQDIEMVQRNPYIYVYGE